MDRTHILGAFENQMLSIFEDEAQAREKLAREVLNQAGPYADAMRALINAQGEAKPYRAVIAAHCERGVPLALALRAERERCTQALVERPETLHTDGISTDIARAEREGARRFLQRTAAYIARLDEAA
ncbi:hypothetical protein [Actinomadura sp. K4S16]|uniref:hypothetical protein n=1 Tax=Actinomadura sp. K4S16 TaxID=1316147 RepID=UPI0011EE0DF2|nr:hypothetical protein [Actinomadura sp. K4S16]